MTRKFIARGLVIDEALVGVQLADRISVPTKRTMTDGGQMHVPCRFARTGEQLYTAGQLGLKGKPSNEVIVVLRDESDVFNQESMETFRSAPVTIGHPKDASGKPISVTAENAKELQVGMLEGMPTRDEDTLAGTLVLTTDEAIKAIEDDQELSAGYVCDIEELDGKFYQRNIRANHIAIVNKGRAGSSCRISDEALEVQLVDEETVKLFADTGLDCSNVTTMSGLIQLVTDSVKELATVQTELATQKELVIDFKEQSESTEIKAKQLEVELADAKLAATEGVIERSQVIEHARLIADMRIEDLSDKSTTEIKRLVVEDQNPEKDYTNKNEAFMDAMFEILVDASKGETPMGKLLRKQDTHVVVDAKPVNKEAEARANMIKRNASLFNNK